MVAGVFSPPLSLSSSSASPRGLSVDNARPAGGSGARLLECRDLSAPAPDARPPLEDAAVGRRDDVEARPPPPPSEGEGPLITRDDGELLLQDLPPPCLSHIANLLEKGR